MGSKTKKNTPYCFACLRSNAGTALVISVIAMFIITSAVTIVLYATTNALYLNSKQAGGTTAFNIAESGAEMAALWLKNQPYPPNVNYAFDPFGGAQVLGEGNYQVTIYPHPDNTSTFLKTFKIVSVGTVGDASKSIEIVVKQSSFGRYAYFTDKETSSVSGGAIWWKADERVDGPVHSNNTGGTNFQINYSGSKNPIFLDMVTASGSSINYQPSRPQNESTFKKIFADGSKGFRLGVTPILLPPSSDAQKNAAWGSITGFPNSNGVYLKADSEGGIYIRGDAAIELSTNTAGNQVVTITQNRKTSTLTLNRTTGKITTTGSMGTGSPTSASSLGSGVIYCTGNITSLKGEVADNLVRYGDIAVRSAFTIAADVNAGKTINVTDNLYYHTRPNKNLGESAPANLAAGTLGLVAKDIVVDSNAPRNLEINAVCLAGGHNTTSGSFYVSNYDKKTPTGTLKVIGGIIQKARGAVGTFNSSTGVTSTGYTKDYSYDPRLAVNPPPFYPTTGQYERLSWQVLPN